MSFLQDRLLPQRQADLAALQVPETFPRTRIPLPAFQKPQGKHLLWIAEVKRASPSLGDIALALSPETVAREYVAHGAGMLSVLTEPHFFKGSFEVLAAVRAAVPDCPLLMKDFVMDPRQVQRGYLAGADAFLLMVAFLSAAPFCELYQLGCELGMTPLVEIHTHAELMQLQHWVHTGRIPSPPCIGVNHRCLHQLSLHPTRSAELYPALRQAFPEALLIAESGLQTPEAVAQMQSIGYEGVLIGSALMGSGTPGETLGAWKVQVKAQTGDGVAP